MRWQSRVVVFVRAGPVVGGRWRLPAVRPPWGGRGGTGRRETVTSRYTGSASTRKVNPWAAGTRRSPKKLGEAGDLRRAGEHPEPQVLLRLCLQAGPCGDTHARGVTHHSVRKSAEEPVKDGRFSRVVEV